MRIILLASAAALAAFSPCAASAATDSQVWTALNATENVGGPWRLQQELIGRFSDKKDGLYEVEGVGLLGYKPSKNVTIAGGYVWNPQYSHGDRTTTEHRLREQITFDNVAMIGRGKISFRYRMEERWRENATGTGWRARPYVKYSLPLGGKMSLTLSSEPWFNLNTTTFQKQSGLERVRNLVAVTTAITKKVSIEAGYMNQYGFVRNGPDTSDHIASLTLFLNV